MTHTPTLIWADLQCGQRTSVNHGQWTIDDAKWTETKDRRPWRGGPWILDYGHRIRDSRPWTVCR
jgi:hypothetical protein